jgi:hypothetical protein
MTINAINLNFLDSSRCLTLPELRVHVNTFIDTGGRLPQNDYQMYLCLAKSVDGDTKEKMESERSDYLAGQAVVPGHVVLIESGLLYMKKLLDTAHADTRATTTHARNNLAGLDVYMSGLPESDIKEFNKYVKQQLQTLTARGETTHDLVTNLFKGYLSVKCEKFVLFIERKRDSYNTNDIDFTPDTLMAVAEKDYDSMKLKGAGTWSPLTNNMSWPSRQRSPSWKGEQTAP